MTIDPRLFGPLLASPTETRRNKFDHVPQEKKLAIKQRRKNILTHLGSEGPATRKMLMDAFAISADTIDRDMVALQAAGEVRTLKHGSHIFFWRPVK